ncbi:hypothetical protein WMF04_28240 [Sorangium sp. So ce260]|uniref:hypothetical protein n=1 Tax=Sorangium sp. So ce260 TaxID=3133291 RepID=UPI003F634E66
MSLRRALRQRDLRRDAAAVCPHLDVEHRAGQNLVWSAALELGWRQLVEQAGGPIALAGVAPDAPAARLVRALNEGAAVDRAPPPGSVVAWAGRGDEPARSALARESEAVFGADGGAALFQGLADGERLAVAGGFAMAPRFAVPFPRRRRPMSFRAQRFACFGLWYDEDEPVERWEERAAQVVIHFPRIAEDRMAELSDEEHDAAYNVLVAELRLADSRYSLLVSTAGRAATLRGTIARTLSYLRDDDDAPNARLTRTECLCLPAVDLRCEASLGELLDQRIANEALRGRDRLGDVRHAIRFRLDGGSPDAISTMRNPFGSALMLPIRWYDSTLCALLSIMGDPTQVDGRPDPG